MLEPSTDRATSRDAPASGRPFILVHLSDMHAGSPYFVPNLMDRAVVEINESEPDVVAMTGDLTNEGFRQEYSVAKGFLDRIACPHLLVVPGNHDSRNVGYVHFEEMFGQYIGAGHACAVNSCTAALHLALIVAGVGPGDEVITTPITFA